MSKRLKWLCLLCLSIGAVAEPLDSIYRAAGVDGVLLIQSLDGEREYVYNADQLDHAVVPASTFKIPHALIALEEGLIESADDVIVWDGVTRSLPQWNRDQTLASAMALSCVWCFRQFADQLTAEVYLDYLRKFDYGNGLVGDSLQGFWLEGDLRVSVRQQVNFLRRFLRQELPVEADHLRILRQILLVEETDDYTLWAKSGWQAPHGWYVGFVETGDELWLFAHYIPVENATALPLRKQLVIAALAATVIAKD